MCRRRWGASRPDDDQLDALVLRYLRWAGGTEEPPADRTPGGAGAAVPNGSPEPDDPA